MFCCPGSQSQTWWRTRKYGRTASPDTDETAGALWMLVVQTLLHGTAAPSEGCWRVRCWGCSGTRTSLELACYR